MHCDFGSEYIPRRQTKNSAGYDFYYHGETVTFKPKRFWKKRTYTIDTGVHLEDGDLKDTSVMLLFPRSSFGKYGFRFTNTVGVIDADYRDSIKCMFTVDKEMTLKDGDRFMQGLITSYFTIPNEILPMKKRVGGIGSTDKS